MRGNFPPENNDVCLPWLLSPYFFYDILVHTNIFPVYYGLYKRIYNTVFKEITTINIDIYFPLYKNLVGGEYIQRSILKLFIVNCQLETFNDNQKINAIILFNIEKSLAFKYKNENNLFSPLTMSLPVGLTVFITK